MSSVSRLSFLQTVTPSLNSAACAELESSFFYRKKMVELALKAEKVVSELQGKAPSVAEPKDAAIAKKSSKEVVHTDIRELATQLVCEKPTLIHFLKKSAETITEKEITDFCMEALQTESIESLQSQVEQCLNQLLVPIHQIHEEQRASAPKQAQEIYLKWKDYITDEDSDLWSLFLMENLFNSSQERATHMANALMLVNSLPRGKQWLLEKLRNFSQTHLKAILTQIEPLEQREQVKVLASELASRMYHSIFAPLIEELRGKNSLAPQLSKACCEKLAQLCKECPVIPHLLGQISGFSIKNANGLILGLILSKYLKYIDRMSIAIFGQCPFAKSIINLLPCFFVPSLNTEDLDKDFNTYRKCFREWITKSKTTATPEQKQALEYIEALFSVSCIFYSFMFFREENLSILLPTGILKEENCLLVYYNLHEVFVSFEWVHGFLHLVPLARLQKLEADVSINLLKNDDPNLQLLIYQLSQLSLIRKRLNDNFETEFLPNYNILADCATLLRKSLMEGLQNENFAEISKSLDATINARLNSDQLIKNAVAESREITSENHNEIIKDYILLFKELINFMAAKLLFSSFLQKECGQLLEVLKYMQVLKGLRVVEELVPQEKTVNIKALKKNYFRDLQSQSSTTNFMSQVRQTLKLEGKKEEPVNISQLRLKKCPSVAISRTNTLQYLKSLRGNLFTQHIFLNGFALKNAIYHIDHLVNALELSSISKLPSTYFVQSVICHLHLSVEQFFKALFGVSSEKHDLAQLLSQIGLESLGLSKEQKAILRDFATQFKKGSVWSRYPSLFKLVLGSALPDALSYILNDSELTSKDIWRLILAECSKIASVLTTIVAKRSQPIEGYDPASLTVVSETFPKHEKSRLRIELKRKVEKACAIINLAKTAKNAGLLALSQDALYNLNQLLNALTCLHENNRGVQTICFHTQSVLRHLQLSIELTFKTLCAHHGLTFDFKGHDLQKLIQLVKTETTSLGNLSSGELADLDSLPAQMSRLNLWNHYPFDYYNNRTQTAQSTTLEHILDTYKLALFGESSMISYKEARKQLEEFVETIFNLLEKIKLK